MLSVVQLQVNPKPLLVQARVGQGDDECSPSLADAIQGPAINAAVAPRLRDHRGPGVSGPPPGELGVVNIQLLRGRSVTHTSERAMWVCAPPEGEKREELRPPH